jgi:membrane protein YqaA with SNARE-associated domain
MKENTSRLYNWAVDKSSATKAPFWFAVLYLFELFLFIPLDAVMLFFSLQNRRNIPLYIALATVASTISGLIGYLFGHFLWDLIGPYVVPHLISQNSFETYANHFRSYQEWAIFFGALLPFPLKALSLIAGVFNLGIVPFTITLLTARLLRFTLVGAAAAIWGEQIKGFVDRHFRGIIFLLGAKIAAASFFFWVMAA